MLELPSSSKIALVDGEESATFHDLNLLIQDKKKKLRAFPQTQCFALLAENSISFLTSLLAALEIRPVAILTKKWTDYEIQTRLDTLKDYCLVANDASDILRREEGSVKMHPDTRLILFTSGSCGNPKAVMLSKANICANTQAVRESLHFNTVSHQHLHLPLSYSFGLLGQVFPALENGSSTYLYKEIMELAYIFDQEHPVGMISAVPEQWRLLCELVGDKTQSCASVSHLVSAGSRLNLETRYKLGKTFPNAILFNNYGMTEFSPRILSLSSEDPNFFSEAVGRPVRGISVSFTEDGILKVKGPQMMLGYLGGDEVKDCILSGDLGYEENGLVYLEGRSDDLIKVSGERISCQDIARQIHSSDCIEDLCVLPFEDAEYGKSLVAFLVLKEGRKDEFMSFLKTHLSGHRKPRKLKFLKEIPLNSNGKTDRQALLKSLEGSV